MAKVSPLQSNFSGGEVTPLLYGRVDSDRYKISLATCLNYIPLIQGGIQNRSGTYYVSSTKTSSKKARLMPFQFSTTQAYVLEVGDLYIRFYRNNGVVESSPGVPYEIATPYLEAHLFELKITQSADILYITHPSYAPRKLTRTAHTAWTLTVLDLLDGPYLPQNTGPMTLTPSAVSGNGITVSSGATHAVSTTANNGSGLIRVTTTAAHGKATGDKVGIAAVVGTTEANGSWTITVISATVFDLQGSAFVNAYVSGGTVYPQVFVSTDVGRLIRFKHSATWGYVKITAFVNYGQVTCNVINTLGNNTAVTIWRLGAWSDTTGYPSCVTFHEDRLFMGGCLFSPQRIDGSRSSEYENYSPTDADGTVTAGHALSFTLNANDVNVLRWISSDEKGLLAGTVGGEWNIRAASSTEALNATNVTAKRATAYGSANVQPVQVGKAALFIQGAGRKLRDMQYYYDVDGFRAADMTLLSEHITFGGIVQLAFQKEPQQIVWAVRADGVLLGMTYERDDESLKVGWHRHELGGSGNAAGDRAEVESVAVIPAADGTRDELWLVVKRYINGATVRHVEYMKKLFAGTDEQEDAFFVDSGLTYDSPVTISAITKANPGVMTATAHGYSNGDSVLVTEVKGMEEVNDCIFKVANKTANTFELTNSAGVNVNTSAYTTYVSGGEVRKLVSTVSNLTHLEGQTVAILADGAPQASKVVSGGAISLSSPAAVIHVGLGYNSDGQMLRLEAGSQDGTALGKIRRTHKVGFYLYRSLGLKYGMSFDDLTEVTFRTSSDKMSRAPELFTGILSENIKGDYDFENQICWRQSQPLPSIILAVMPQMVTQDGG